MEERVRFNVDCRLKKDEGKKEEGVEKVEDAFDFSH